MIGRLTDDRKVYVETPRFTGRNVKISEIAKATGKDPNYIRSQQWQRNINLMIMM